MKFTRAVNIRVDACDVYVGRGSKWGNPFHLGPDGTREQVISKYRIWLHGQTALLAHLHELAGKRLGCFCKPKLCHADVLADLINERVQLAASMIG